MKGFKKFFILTSILFFSGIINAQSFYRPWSSYKPVKPQKPYEKIDTLSPKLRTEKCYWQNYSYEPNEILTKLDISQNSTFEYFKNCCKVHSSRCVNNYIGTNNKTLLYTMVEKRAYPYMEWILTNGFVYDANIDSWGVYTLVNDKMIPLRTYTPMMLACNMGDLKAIKILRAHGAYLSKPENGAGDIPFDIAHKSKNLTSQFIEYIDSQYKEEIKNISDQKDYGTTFEVNIIQNLIDSFEENFIQNQQKVIEKALEINKA